MNREEKKEYLESYKEAFLRYEELNLSLETLKSVDYTRVKASTHRTLTDRIYERDKAYNAMVERMLEIEKLLENKHLVLRYRYLDFKTVEEIAEILHYHITYVFRLINKEVDKLDI